MTLRQYLYVHLDKTAIRAGDSVQSRKMAVAQTCFLPTEGSIRLLVYTHPPPYNYSMLLNLEHKPRINVVLFAPSTKTTLYTIVYSK